MQVEQLAQVFEDFLQKYGHKVIYRRYHTGVPSEHRSPMTNEGVGGSRWKYTDEVWLCRESSRSASTDRGEFEGGTVYYLPADASPKVSDRIIEVRGNNGPDARDEDVLNAHHSHVVRIRDIKAERGARGEVVFYQCYVIPDYGYY